MTLIKGEYKICLPIKPWHFINCFAWSGGRQIFVPCRQTFTRVTQLSDSLTLFEHQGNIGIQKVFIQSALFYNKPVIQWICFGRCLLTDILAADDGSSVRDEETKRLQLSVSKQWAGFCFSKVKQQSEKGDLHILEHTYRNEKSDGQYPVKISPLKY